MVIDICNTMVNLETSVKIGDRIECSGKFGTIKYNGPVKGYPGIWFGVDWDDPNRGKHNGTVDDVQYFFASHPKSGSFVRPEKIQIGHSAIKAITSRYGQRDDDITERNNLQQLLSVQQTMNAPFLKMVGFDEITNRQGDFSNLRVVNLRMQNVCYAGEPQELQKLCPNLAELDISKNLLTNWLVVFDICSQLTNLTWLNVSENRLEIPDDFDNFKFTNIKTLICGSMNLNWSDVLRLSQVFPNLEELRLQNNCISDLDTPNEHSFSGLKLLDLENNKVGDWKKICKLSIIDSLEQLNLEFTDLQSINFEVTSKKTDCFKSLQKIVLSENWIDDWVSVGELNKLQNLEDLRLLKNPIFMQESYATCLQMIVARIENLKVFNGAVIKSDERRGAEYDYIKKYGLEWLASKEKGTELEFFQKHNRYEELVAKYGAPEEAELKIQSKTINVSLVELELDYSGLIIKKKLPPSILIQKLIMLVQRLFKLSERPQLLYVSGSQSDIEIELNDEVKELGFYSIQDGDKILVKV